jgi:hypothetical protein
MVDQPDIELCNFTLELAYAVLDPLKMDSEDDDLLVLETMEESFESGHAAASSIGQEMAEMSTPALTDLPPPNTPAQPNVMPKKRFKLISETEIKSMFDSRKAEATIRTTAWGVKMFEGRHDNTLHACSHNFF